MLPTFPVREILPMCFPRICCRSFIPFHETGGTDLREIELYRMLFSCVGERERGIEKENWGMWNEGQIPIHLRFLFLHDSLRNALVCSSFFYWGWVTLYPRVVLPSSILPPCVSLSMTMIHNPWDESISWNKKWSRTPLVFHSFAFLLFCFLSILFAGQTVDYFSLVLTITQWSLCSSWILFLSWL